MVIKGFLGERYKLKRTKKMREKATSAQFRILKKAESYASF
jgi:hypothetical protein